MDLLSGPKANWLDRFAAAISPSWGESRMKARHVFEANRIRAKVALDQARQLEERHERRMEEARYFEGADSDDRTSFGWQVAKNTPNYGMLCDLREMQQRSRYLAFSDDYFSGAVEGCIYQVVGKGIRMQSLARDCPAHFGVPAISEQTAETVRKELEQLWMDQCEDFMLDGSTFSEGVEQALWHELVDGSGPMLMSDVERSGPPTSLALEVIDPWLIDRPPTSDVQDNFFGVEVKDGKPTRIHYRKDWNTFDYTSVEAERMPIVFRRRWAGQQLGLPWIFAGSGRCYDRKTASEAELISNQIASCFSLFITTGGGAWGNGDEQVQDSKNQAMRRFKNLRPGQIIVGQPGEQVTPIAPNRPSNTYGPFMEVNLRGTGAALNYPYEYLSNDFSKTTYLSGRMSQILGREGFNARQRMIGRRLCSPVWRAFVARCVLKKLLSISPRQYVANRRAVESHQAQPRGYMWIDPPKDIAAAIDGIEHGTGTYRDYYESIGEDWEEQFDQQEREQEARAKRNLPDPFAKPTGPQAVAMVNNGQPTKSRESPRRKLMLEDPKEDDE